MERLLLLLALLCTGHAIHQDMSEKVFTFPTTSATSYVKLTPSSERPTTALTMCMRFHSAQTRAQTLFSLATQSAPNAFLLYKPSATEYRLHLNEVALDIPDLADNTDEWNSVCWTWDSASGVTTLWVNGKRSDRKILGRGVTLTGTPSIILGQDQDTFGGGFDQSQSFLGDIADVHLWSSIISPCEIRFYMEGSAFTSGDLINWKNLEYTSSGSVLVEKSDFDKLMCY